MKLKDFARTISPEWLFLVFALTFGTAITVMTPPFQTPDEFHHFFKAYQVADGHFTGEQKDNRLGGYVPASLVNASMSFKPVRNGEHTNRKAILTFLNTPLKTDTVVFTDFPNTAIYSPVSYLPQALSIFVLKKLHFSIGYIFYGARFFTFLTWIVAIFYSIRVLPAFKKLFMLLALLPMSLSVNSSLSADVVTNIGAFVMIAYILKCAFSEKKFTTADFTVITLLLILLASAKLLYIPLILLFFIIPKEKFATPRIFYTHFVSLLVLGIVVASLWAGLINHLHIPYSDYNPLYRDHDIDVYHGANIYQQAQFIEDNKLHFIKIMLNSIMLPDYFPRYTEGYIGILGWFDMGLFFWLYILAYMVIFFTAFTENGYTDKAFTMQNKIAICISFLSILFLIHLSQYLTFASVGEEAVVMQGRYFIPVFPLLFMLFNRKGFKRQYLITPVIIIFLLTILSITLVFLFFRYYYPYPLSTLLEHIRSLL